MARRRMDTLYYIAAAGCGRSWRRGAGAAGLFGRVRCLRGFNSGMWFSRWIGGFPGNRGDYLLLCRGIQAHVE